MFQVENRNSKKVTLALEFMFMMTLSTYRFPSFLFTFESVTIFLWNFERVSSAVDDGSFKHQSGVDPDTLGKIQEVTLLTRLPVEKLHAGQVSHVLAANDHVPLRFFF
jgi:hypothetical protein